MFKFKVSKTLFCRRWDGLMGSVIVGLNLSFLSINVVGRDEPFVCFKSNWLGTFKIITTLLTHYRYVHMILLEHYYLDSSIQPLPPAAKPG